MASSTETTLRCDDPRFADYEDCSWCGGSGVELDGCSCGDGDYLSDRLRGLVWVLQEGT